MKTFDIIIPLALKDIFIIRKNVYYINKYLSPSSIYIVTNKNLFPFFSQSFRNNYKIELIDEDKMIKYLSYRLVKKYMNKHLKGNHLYGWYFQQFIKMGFSEICNSNFYLIWDADTIPTSNITFFNEKGQILHTTRIDYNKDYFDTIKKLLNLETYANSSFITEHMMINTDQMKKLIKEINSNCKIEGNNWIEKCINAINKNVLHGFSEFETYGNYVLNREPQMYISRELNTFRDAGRLYGRYISKKTIINKFEGKYSIISLELWQTPRFPYCIIDIPMKLVFKILTKILRKL